MPGDERPGRSLRPRRPGDLPALVEILARTHAESAYPKRASNVRAGWIADPQELGAWVALDGDRVVGHVALHPAHGASVELWRQGTGRRDDEIAVVSRLFSDARGAGSALLAHAVREAAPRSPALEVEVASPAYAFYLRRGWTEVGRVTQQWGTPVPAAVLVLSGAAGR